MENLINIAEKYINPQRSSYPDFKQGDNIVVHIKIKEGSKERIQKFQGTVLRRKNIGTNNETFSVRKISDGVGVEKIFSAMSPSIEKIELVRHGRVRRAKLYYLRNKYGKSATVKEKMFVSNKKAQLSKK